MALLAGVDLSGLLTAETLISVARAVLIAVLGFIALRILVVVTRRVLKGKTTDQIRMLVTKAIMYIGTGILLAVVLMEMGVNLTPLLGAAGIAGLAIGIASQASLSNIVSGIFLVSEKPFAVGDVIKSGDKTGIVMSIDLLSVKIRTFDNLYVRIPNERIANTELTNVTKFPIRRMDFDVSVAYKEDLAVVREALLEVAKENPYCLDEPEPLILFKNFGDSGIELLFAVWFAKTDFLLVKNSVFPEIKTRFADRGIEIPFPHRSIYAGEATKPFPVQVVASDDDLPAE